MALGIAVIGAGKMGSSHARIYDSLKDVSLELIVDTDPAAASALAERYECSWATDVEDLSKVEAASICVPSTEHALVATRLLEGGIHCLVEKPFALSHEECLEMIAAAEISGSCLGIGHIERFNPAVEELNRLVAGREVWAVETRRMSSLSSRITDVDVVLDLMIHDLDIVRSLIPFGVDKCYAVGIGNGLECGYSTATIRFDNGSVASLTASRITQSKVRELFVTSELGFIALDYLTQSLQISREGHLVDNRMVDDGRYTLELAMEQIFVRKQEPLLAELNDFVGAVIGNRKPRVTGHDALASLKLAWQIRQQLDVA